MTTEYLGVAQFGSVLEWGSRGRRFESSHPDQSKSPEITMVSGLLLFPSLDPKYSNTKPKGKLLEENKVNTL